jgi:hypothetical protein
MTAMIELTTPALRIGGVFATSLHLLLRNFVTYGVLGLLCFLPSLALNRFTASHAEAWWTGLASTGINLTFGQMLTAIVTFGVFQSLRGQPVSLLDCVRRGLRRLLSLIGVGILSSLIIGFYTLLLIVPGIMRSAALWVVVPVNVVEGLSASDCIDRSERLTSGYRWHIFGIQAIVIVLMIAWSALLDALYGVAMQTPDTIPLSYSIANYVGDAALAVLSSVVTTAGYFQLRQIKDGISLDVIAAIFD